jgi:pimeloyl-ACP methyl ester carboxylesterase
MSVRSATMIILAAAAGLALLPLAAKFLERRASYYPIREFYADPSAVGLPFEDVLIRSGGLILHGWYCRPPSGRQHRADALFFHGNAGNVSHRLAKIKGLADLGLGVFVFDYRGFGRSEGTPDDAGILADSRAALSRFRELVVRDGRPAGFFAESIGCLPAVRLAAGEAGPAFLVLEGSFPDKRAVAAGTPLFWWLIPFLSRALDMGDAPGRVACPSLVMHARHDEIIPAGLGRRVHRLLGRRSVFAELSRGGHNDVFLEDGDFFPAIGRFLDGLPAGARTAAGRGAP